MPLDSRTGATFTVLARHGAAHHPASWEPDLERLLGAGLRARGRAAGVARPGAFGAAVGRLRPRVRAAPRARLEARRGRRGVAPARSSRRSPSATRAGQPTSSSSGGGADRGGLPPRRGSRPAAAAAAAEHGQPARERDARSRAAARLPRGGRRRGRALRAHAGARQPRRAPARRLGAEPLLPLAHRHRPRRPGGVVARPVVGRPRRRPRLGPRRARHEEPGRGERRRDRLARAGGLQTVRRPRLRRGRGRGGREGVRVAVALRGASRRGSRRLRDQRGRRRTDRRRRQAALPLRRRGEDVGAVPAPRARAERPCVDAGDRGQRAREGGAADRAARRLRAGADDRPRGGGLPRRGARGAAGRRRGARPAPRRRRGRGRDDRAAARVHALADDDLGVRAAERRLRDLRGRRRPAGCCPDRRPRTSTRCCAHPRRGRLRAGDDRALGRDALAARHAALGGDRRVARDDRAGRDAGAALLRGLHRLALAPRGLRHRRVRLLPDER